MSVHNQLPKVYSVTLWNPDTGDKHSVDVDAHSAEQAKKKVRGIYGKPGYIISDVKRVAP